MGGERERERERGSGRGEYISFLKSFFLYHTQGFGDTEEKANTVTVLGRRPGSKRRKQDMIQHDDIDVWFSSLVAFDACVRLAESAENLSRLRLIRPSPIEGKQDSLPSFCDFLADLDLAARSVLDRQHHLMFRAVWIEHRESWKSLPHEALGKITTAVGEELIRRGIYAAGYFYQSTASVAERAEQRAREQRIACEADRKIRRRKNAKAIQSKAYVDAA
jgi:hypothetical protein